MTFLIISSVLTALSMPGFLAGFIVWFSLVFLFKALENKGPLLGAVYGFTFYYVFSLINLFWVLPVLTENLPRVFSRFPGWVGFFVFLLMCAIQALPFAGFGLIYGFAEKSIKTNPYKEILFTAGLYTLFDYLRSVGEMGFTGGTLSDALYKDIGIIQLVSIIGPYGLTFAIVAFNCWLYISLRKSLRPFEKSVFYVLLVIAVSHIISLFLPLPTTSDKAIVAFQTNVEQNEKYSNGNAYLLNRYLPLIGTLQDSFVVFPEEAFTNEIRGTEVEKVLREMAESSNLRFLVCFPTLEEDGYCNSAVLLDMTGTIDKYSKVKLFPFVEMVPYPKIFNVFSFLRGVSYLKPGKEYRPLIVSGYPPLGVQICFESYFSQPSRKLVENGAQILIICTNDGWFAFDVALKQHFAKAVIRAVENRRQVIQVSNSGITGSIDPYGRILKIIPVRTEQVSTLDLIPREGRTIYSKVGDIIIWFSVITVIVFLLFPGQRRLSKRRRIWR